MIKLSTVFRYLTGQAFNLYIDSGGGGGGPSTTTNVTTNIPEYARPYVETMLGSAQNELFNYETVKPENPFAQYIGQDGMMGQLAADFEAQNPGKKTPTSLKGYQAFGGTYDQNPTIFDEATSKYVANPNYGKQTGYDADKYFAGFQPLQEKAFGAAGDLGVNQQTMQAGNMAGDIANRALGTKYEGDQYGNAYQGMQAYDPGQYNQQSVNAQGLQNYQMGPAEQVASQNFGNQSAQDYMSPYMQNVVDMQQRSAERASQMQGQQNNAAAVGAGAFGGSRQGLMEAERQRNLATQKEGIQAQGLQSAFQQAQTQFNADQARQQAAQQANQSAGLTVGQQNLAANLGVQSLGAGQSLEAQKANQATNLATQQAQQAANQYGYGQGMANQQNLAQYGQAANALNANQDQFAANLGLQGLQAANTAANTMGTAGQQAYAQQTGAINLQNQLGSQQQQSEQAKIDQQIKDYANQQQWSMQQLGNMSNLLRGLPMQSTTTSAYQATPSAASQIAGLGTTAVAGAKLAGMAKGGKVRSGIDHLGMYNAMKK